jgi:ABC-type bacteriocin/lantibiotic exporter with double-glycine peptidase domain
MIARSWGRSLSLNQLRELLGVGTHGSSLLDLQRGADRLGFHAQAVRAVPEVLDRLDEVPLPAVLHWQGNHWVVLYGQRRGQFVIADPGAGLRTLSREELQTDWDDGVMLLLSPDELRFAPGDDRPAGWSRQLAQSLRPHWGTLGQVAGFGAVIGGLAIALPFAIQYLTDEVLVRGDRDLVNGVAIAVVLAVLFGSALEWIQANLTAHFTQRLELSLVLSFGRKLLRLPLSYYESRRSGEIVSRLHDLQEIDRFVAQMVVTLPSQMPVAIVSLGLMLLYSPVLSVVAVAIALLMATTTVLLLPRLQHQTRRLLILEAETQAVLVETFKGAATLKLTNATPQLWDELQRRFGRLARLGFQTAQIGYGNGIFAQAVAGLGTVILLWLGSQLVVDDVLSIGQLLAFLSLNRNVTALVDSGVALADESARIRTAMERVTEVLEHHNEGDPHWDQSWHQPVGSGAVGSGATPSSFASVVQSPGRSPVHAASPAASPAGSMSAHSHSNHSPAGHAHASPTPSGKPTVCLPADADIHFEQVAFRYPGRADLFSDLNLSLRGGQTIALVGPSGCGKSTLAKLMVGLYPVAAGNIRIDRYNLGDLDLAGVRRQVVLVPQDAHFWGRSIVDNFRLGQPELSFEAMVAACQLTGADEFIAQLPEKYQTVLGEFGASLSGGQRQKLAIARALAAQPPILILDESTSNLDPASEEQLLDRLATVRQGKTTVVIGHRPSLVQRSHWVVALDRGQISAQGTAYTIQADWAYHHPQDPEHQPLRSAIAPTTSS